MTAKARGDTPLGAALIEALEEVRAWRRGEVALEMRVVHPPMPPERVRAIRRKVGARSTREFERRFGVPAATVNNWEQGRRRPDPAARVLLRVIEADPAAVEAVVRRVAPQAAETEREPGAAA